VAVSGFSSSSLFFVGDSINIHAAMAKRSTLQTKTARRLWLSTTSLGFLRLCHNIHGTGYTPYPCLLVRVNIPPPFVWTFAASAFVTALWGFLHRAREGFTIAKPARLCCARQEGRRVQVLIGVPKVLVRGSRVAHNGCSSMHSEHENNAHAVLQTT